jgi:hypothetical protein
MTFEIRLRARLLEVVLRMVEHVDRLLAHVLRAIGGGEEIRG